jgi:hypothetical protein
MAQFAANLVQAAYCRVASPYPRFLSELLLWYMLSLLALFGAARQRRSLRTRARLSHACARRASAAGSFYYNKHVAGAKKSAGGASSGGSGVRTRGGKKLQ